MLNSYQLMIFQPLFQIEGFVFEYKTEGHFVFVLPFATKQRVNQYEKIVQGEQQIYIDERA